MTPQPFPQQPPINSVSGIEALILFGLQVFSQVFFLFNQQNVPVTAAPHIIQQLNQTPGATQEHQTVVNAAVNAAIAAHNVTN